MTLGINLILFLPSYIATHYSVGVMTYWFSLVLLIIAAYLQCECAEILTQLINLYKSCREINPSLRPYLSVGGTDLEAGKYIFSYQ